jgi:hypothetical protein
MAAAAPAWAQSDRTREGFWADIQLGYGVLDTSSDQEPGDQRGTFAFGLSLGSTLNRHVRLGVHIGGWLQEAFDPWDPEKGESVSQFLAVVLVHPWSARALFLRAGAGRAFYTDNDPNGFGSSGWGQTIGVGYDWPVGGRISLTPVVNYGRGTLGHVENALVTIRNRRYRVLEFGLGLSY